MGKHKEIKHKCCMIFIFAFLFRVFFFLHFWYMNYIVYIGIYIFISYRMSCLKHNSISLKNFTLKNLSTIFSLFLANSLFRTIYHLSLAVSFSLNKLCTINFIDVCVCVCVFELPMLLQQQLWLGWVNLGSKRVRVRGRVRCCNCRGNYDRSSSEINGTQKRWTKKTKTKFKLISFLFLFCYSLSLFASMRFRLRLRFQFEFCSTK